MTVDWDQFVRNLLYGAVHRPAQVLAWLGGLYSGEADPVGAALKQMASEIDSAAFLSLRPYVAPTQGPGMGAGGLSVSPPPAPATWVKPQGSVFPWLSCPNGYTLQKLEPIEIPGFSCLLNGANWLPQPPLSDWAF